MAQSLSNAGVGITKRGGEFVGSGKVFRLGEAGDSGNFLHEFSGLFSPGMIFLVEDAKLQNDDFSDRDGGPAVVVMKHGDIQVTVDRNVPIFA